MVHIDPDHGEHKPRRSDGYVLTLRSLVLLLVGAGVVLLWVHDPRWGAAVLGGVTVLTFLAKMVKLVRAGVRLVPPAARQNPVQSHCQSHSATSGDVHSAPRGTGG
jgi:hypothetical protein